MIYRAIWLFFFNAVSLVSCMEREEGCLDPYAVNFRASATESCCCNYARVRVQWHKTYMDEMVGDSTQYTDHNGWSFYLKNLDFVFSEIELENTNKEVFIVRDSVLAEFYHSADTDSLIDDPARFSLQGNFSTLGSMRAYGNTEDFHLRVGLNEKWNQVNPASLSASHILNREPYLFLDSLNGYLILQLEVLPDLDSEGGLVVSINNPPDRIILQIPLQLEIPRNVDFDIPLEIKLDVLFNTVSFLEMSNDEIGQLILANLKDAVNQHMP